MHLHILLGQTIGILRRSNEFESVVPNALAITWAAAEADEPHPQSNLTGLLRESVLSGCAMSAPYLASIAVRLKDISGHGREASLHRLPLQL